MRRIDRSDLGGLALSLWLIGAGGFALAQQGPAPEPLPQPRPGDPGSVNPGDAPNEPQRPVDTKTKERRKNRDHGRHDDTDRGRPEGSPGDKGPTDTR
jgi:hypothetical protein